MNTELHGQPHTLLEEWKGKSAATGHGNTLTEGYQL